METQHTPGEWKSIGLEIRQKNSGLILANVYEHNPNNQTKEQAIANAKLIAAAPDLLDALLKLQYAVKHGGVKGLFEDEKKLIDNAINKAIGE